MVDIPFHFKFNYFSIDCFDPKTDKPSEYALLGKIETVKENMTVDPIEGDLYREKSLHICPRFEDSPSRRYFLTKIYENNIKTFLTFIRQYLEDGGYLSVKMKLTDKKVIKFFFQNKKPF